MAFSKSRVGASVGKGHAAEPMSPAAILQAAVKGQNHDRLIHQLAAHLHRPGYSVIDFLHDVAVVKTRLAADGPIDQQIEGWKRLDRVVEDCIALVSAARETFIEATLHAFCELDGDAIIVSANRKMRQLAPDCVGRDLPPLFGESAGEVRQLLISGAHQLYHFELVTEAKRHPVLVEFGRFISEQKTGGFAFLIDMSDAVEAEHRALDASPHGIVKLDARSRILYANQNLLDILELPFDEVCGRDARDFVKDNESLKEVNHQIAERQKGRGGEYEITITRAKSGTKTRLRLTSYPSFEASGQYAGMLTSVVPIDGEIARNEIARLVATQTSYQALFEGVIEIVKRFIAFDWADLSVFTPERDYALSFCRYAAEGESKPYAVRWWEILPTHHDSIEKCPIIADLATFLVATPEGRNLLERTAALQDVVKEGRRGTLSLAVRNRGQIVGCLSLQSRRPDCYNDNMLKLLRELGVDQAMQAAFSARERAESEFVSELLRKITAAKDHMQLAETIVAEIANFYGFENVSIFKVNLLRGHFSISGAAPWFRGRRQNSGGLHPVDNEGTARSRLSAG
jgi:PAS domain S-box-containing protein